MKKSLRYALSIIFLTIIFLILNKPVYPQDIYYVGAPGTKPGGGDPDFFSLKEVCDTLESKYDYTHSGNIYVYITSDLIEPEKVTCIAGALEYDIQFQSLDQKRTITFTNEKDEYPGGWIVGGGNIRIYNLTIQSDPSSSKYTIPLKVTSPYFVDIFNCNIYYKSKTTASDTTDSLTYGALIMNFPYFCSIGKNHISSNFPGVSRDAMGIYSNGLYKANIFENNIEAKQRGIHCGSSERSVVIEKNNILLNQDMAPINVLGMRVGGHQLTFVNENQILLSANNYSMNSGAVGIIASGYSVLNNNFISGFFLNDMNVTEASELTGIILGSSAAAFNNQIIFKDIEASNNNGNFQLICVQMFPPGSEIKNNYFLIEEDSVLSYAIHIPSYPYDINSFQSDTNTFHLSGLNTNVGYWIDTPGKTLTDWQKITGRDLNSIYNPVVPVELTSFTADIQKNSVLLKWTTGTETNNRGFEIQKLFTNLQEWKTIGFISGKGTTTETQYYSFEDKSAANGIYSYRLKQIDYDGKFSYSQIIEIDFTAVNEFHLSQNYPNPFNPSTQIEYTIPAESPATKGILVTFKIYDMLGDEIATLVNKIQPPGKYKINFDASALASGVYLYKLKAGDFIQIKKMSLLK